MIRVSKRLTQATGYLELDMCQQALECLDNLGPLGPFEGEVELLRGDAFRRQRRFREAARSFKAAAQKFSLSAQDRETYLAMWMCYRQAGNMPEAMEMLARARGATLRAAE
jgi:tetratricopeptide (TPR) repeat protein